MVLSRIKKQTFSIVMLALLLPLLSAQFISSAFAPYANHPVRTDHSAGVAIQARATCPQQKNAQTQSPKPCQAFKLQFYILPDFLQFFQSLSGRIQLLYLLGLLAMSPIRRIFRPPKFQFAF